MLVQEEGEDVEEGEDIEEGEADDGEKSTDGEIDVGGVFCSSCRQTLCTEFHYI